MSLYATVLAEFANPPRIARREDFTSYFGYAGGASLGSFGSIAEANDAGAKTTEKVFDEAGFKDAQNVYADFHKAVNLEYMTRLRAQHTEVNEKVFDLAYSEAYERGHSHGNGEVELYLDDMIDFALKVIAASK